MKLTLHLLRAVLFLCVSIQTFCMEEQSKAQKYFKECRAITKKSEKKLNDFILHASAINPDEKIDSIKGQLKRLQKKVDETRKDELTLIKKKYDILESNWDARIKIAQQLYDYEKQNKHIELPGAIHDANIPADILLMLKKNLTDNGIAPKRYTLQLSHTGRFLMRFPGVEGFKNSKAPGKIVISSKTITNFSLIKKEGLCFMMVHPTSDVARYDVHLLAALDQMNGFFDEKNHIFLKKEDLPRFRARMGAIALFTAALKDGYYARIIKACYWMDHQSGISHKNNHKLFCKIDRLHRSLDWLKRYAIGPIEKSIVSDFENKEEQEEISKK